MISGKLVRVLLPTLCALGLGLLWIADLKAAETRTWSDASGKFKIQAKFVSNDNGKVTLEKSDGTEMEIDLKKLSAADQKYIADLAKSAPNPFKTKEDDPFKSKPAGGGSKTTGKPGGTGKPADSPRATETRLIVPDFSDAKVVTVSPPDQAWKFEIAETPAETGTSKAKPKTIPTPKKTDFFEGSKGLVGSSNGKFAAIGYSLQKPGVNQPSTSRVVVCNLETAKMIGEGSLPGKSAPLAIHNDGKQVLMRRDEFGHGNQDRLEIWNVAAKSAAKTIQCVPYDDFSGGDRDVAWGAFIGDDRIATVSGKGKLVVWNLDDMKPIYTMDIQGGSKPAISPDQKLLAFATGKEIGILDLAEGEIVAMQTTPQVQWPVLAFSPGQKRLGMAAFDRLFVWDVSNGELYREMPYQGLHVMGNITWPSDDHVLLGNRFLIDLENQVKLWDYQGAEFAQQFAGTTWFVVTDAFGAPGALLGAQLPPPAVKDALAKAMSAPDFFVLKPGTTVKIDVSQVDAAGKEFVEKALTARLKEAGFEASPMGTIDLVAQTEMGAERQVSYHTFGRIGSQTYNVRDYFSRIKFVYKGQEVWQTGVGSVPGFIHLGQNETMEQFLKKSEKFNFDWFGKVDLPKLLQKPSQTPSQVAGGPPVQVPTVGSTKLTPSGAK
jgi:WD40 repeat protein